MLYGPFQPYILLNCQAKLYHIVKNMGGYAIIQNAAEKAGYNTQKRVI